MKIMPLFDLIERLITEHGSATILRDHVALLKEQFFIADRETVRLVSKNQILEAENVALKAENIAFKQENENLRIQIRAIKKQTDPDGDPCPYCRRPQGQLVDLKPHEIFGEVGIKTGFYKCRNCGKEYEKERKP